MAVSAQVRAAKIAKQRTTGTARRELCDLLRIFYGNGWVSGTGGGICRRLSRDELLLAPSAVHKERVQPNDFFVVAVGDGRILRRPKDRTLRPSECNAVFRAILRRRNAGSVVHSHALSAVLAADLAARGSLGISGFEMLKGIRGVSNLEVHQVPVIRNTAEEPALAADVALALREPRFARAYCVLVRDHGAYIWGADVSEAKRHAEVYHFLFEGIVARQDRSRGRS